MKMLVVESAAKARTIQKYLRDEWAVLATGGHVQDLPSGPEHGKAGRKATFAEGRDGLPNPPWVWTDRGEQAMRKIFDRADKEGISEFFLATDPDREGEFIAWRLQALLEDRGATHRVTFHEVTADAIADAIGRPRRVDMHLVESASVRKFLDRFVGFRTSKLARAYLSGGGKASMGRVQTPTLGFIVERELEREAHIPIPFFEVRALTAGDEGVEFSARFHEPKDPDAWRDDADKVHPTRTSHTALATETHGGLVSAGVLTITQAKRGASSRKPRTAFSTDQLLQAAGNRWGWSPGRTMRTATELYEGGHITYIRTDSNRMSATFVESARALIEKDWGKDYLGAGAAAVKPTGKVQDAHEAIRPTRADVVKPEGIEGPASQLYTLVRAQALASQMAPAQYARIALTCSAEGVAVPLTGGISWRVHPGWQAAFASLDKKPVEAPPKGTFAVGGLLKLAAGDSETPNPRLIEDATKPPGRFRPHSVVKAMKENGIGRPSTYASTVETLKDRRYVDVEEGALIPTVRGRAVWLEVAPLYDEGGAEEGDSPDAESPAQDQALFSVGFTAEMEAELDHIETGATPARAVWARFRDSVRSLHNTARGHMNSGLATPKRVDQLEGLLTMAPDDFKRPENVAKMTQQATLAMITELRGLGVKPPPSPQQLAYIRRMAEKLQLTDEVTAGLIDRPDLETLTTSEQASTLITVLQEKLTEERPPSPKQLGLIRSLIKKLEMAEEAALLLVEGASLETLTGGRSGTASAMIDALQALQRGKKKGPDPNTPQSA